MYRLSTSLFRNSTSNRPGFRFIRWPPLSGGIQKAGLERPKKDLRSGSNKGFEGDIGHTVEALYYRVSNLLAGSDKVRFRGKRDVKVFQMHIIDKVYEKRLRLAPEKSYHIKTTYQLLPLQLWAGNWWSRSSNLHIRPLPYPRHLEYLSYSLLTG